MLPKITDYGKPRRNSGNTRKIELANVTLWYSYETVIAFQAAGGDLVISENLWGPTTGKHINWIADGRNLPRINRAEFERQLEKVMSED